MGVLGGEDEHQDLTQMSFTCASPTPGEGWQAHRSPCVWQRVDTPQTLHEYLLASSAPPLPDTRAAAATAFQELTAFPVPSLKLWQVFPVLSPS